MDLFSSGFGQVLHGLFEPFESLQLLKQAGNSISDAQATTSDIFLLITFPLFDMSLYDD
jgi:hypothetical protein